MNLAASRIPPDPSDRERQSLPAPSAASPSLHVISARHDDFDLVRRMQGGDATALRALMHQHLSAVLATVRRLLRDHAEAEDVAQETFLRLWRNVETIEVGPYGIRPWLRRVASNLAIDCLRKSDRFDVTDDLPERREEPMQLKELEAGDTTARVEAALAQLPDRQRIALSLFHFDELSQRDVAELMAVSEDALESLLARGRRRLRDMLKDDWRGLLADIAGQ